MKIFMAVFILVSNAMSFYAGQVYYARKLATTIRASISEINGGADDRP